MDIRRIRAKKLRKWINERFSGRQSDFANSINETPNVISRFFMDWDNVGHRKIGEKKARAIELASGMPKNYLDIESELIEVNGNILSSSPNSIGVPIYKEVPLISNIQAGHWNENTDIYSPGDCERMVKVTEKVSDSAYALRVVGDSMQPTLPEGSIIIVDPNRNPENGQIVVIRQNGDSEATVKRLINDGGRKYLKPDNERYPIMEMLDDAHFCGVAVELTNSLI